MKKQKKTFSDWQAIADRILSTAAKSTFQNVWLTKPWEYIDFIEKADDKIVNSTSLQKHIERITLYGTMVGFAFILPEALRKQACRAQEQLKSITIIASDEETIVGDSSRQLVCYPLWLIVRLTQLLLECNRFISPIISGCHDFNIKIGYLPHDVFTAAIHLPPNEMVVLQALDSLALIRVLEGIEMQRGFLYTNENAKNDLYDRYVAVLRSLENQFYTNAKRKREGQRKREKWRFVGTGGNLVLEISNPHWTWNNNAIDKILSKEEYDEADDRVLTFPTSNISIKSFLDMFLQRLQMEGTTGNDLRSFESMIQRKKQVWAKHHPLECLCSLTKYE